ncbi:hypothetical protein ACLESO_52315, partial [Pyxidicoccus sp. 3LG]
QDAAEDAALRLLAAQTPVLPGALPGTPMPAPEPAWSEWSGGVPPSETDTQEPMDAHEAQGGHEAPISREEEVPPDFQGEPEDDGAPRARPPKPTLH